MSVHLSLSVFISFELMCFRSLKQNCLFYLFILFIYLFIYFIYLFIYLFIHGKSSVKKNN